MDPILNCQGTLACPGTVLDVMLLSLVVRGGNGRSTCWLLLVGVPIWLLRGWGAVVGPAWRILLVVRLVILRGQLDGVVGRSGHAVLWRHARPAGSADT